MDSDLLVQVFDYIAEQGTDVYSLLVIRNGHIVVEAYRAPYRNNSRFEVHSVTKSFTGALVGIAIEQGYIEGIDQSVLSFFPDDSFDNTGYWKESIMLEHLLTMTCGLDWPELTVSYSSSDNVARRLSRSGNWARYVLGRPMAAEPGTTYNYNSGCSHLLSVILQEATGMTAFEYGREALFRPLDISTVTWSSTPDRTTNGFRGIRMSARDMAKLGQLYLQGGVWEGERVMSAEWVESSTTGQVQAWPVAPYYGYQWWVFGSGVYGAFGYRGQRVLVVPDLEMVVVVTGSITDNAPIVLLNSYIVPAAVSFEPLEQNPEGHHQLEERIYEVMRIGSVPPQLR